MVSKGNTPSACIVNWRHSCVRTALSFTTDLFKVGSRQRKLIQDYYTVRRGVLLGFMENSVVATVQSKVQAQALAPALAWLTPPMSWAQIPQWGVSLFHFVLFLRYIA